MPTRLLIATSKHSTSKPSTRSPRAVRRTRARGSRVGARTSRPGRCRRCGARPSPRAWPRAPPATLPRAPPATPPPSPPRRSPRAPSSRSALGHVGRVDAWRDRGFASAAEHRAHRKSDLHRHNLRRAASGRAEVTEEEFAEALARGGGDDVSSISGSDDDDSSDDDDDDDDGAPDHPSRLAPSPAAYRAVHGAAEGPQVVCFPAPDPRAESSATSPAPPPYAVWRCVLEPQQSARGGASSDSSATHLRSALLRLRADPSKPWVVILSRGGHFAGAAFEPARFGDAFPREGPEGDRGRSSGASRAIGGSFIAPSNSVVAHKTFHRYVVRAKAGGRQSVKDQGGGKTIKSAGSSMRRQNELALRNEVLKTLAEWRGVLRDAALIFVAASKTDASTIFDEKSGSPIRADDPRVRRVPFATKRPTFAETRRVVARLAGVNPRVRAVDDGSEKDKSPGETTLEPFQTQKGKKKTSPGKKRRRATQTPRRRRAPKGTASRRRRRPGWTPSRRERRAPRARWRPRRTRRPRSPRSRTWRSRIIARRGPRRVAPSLTRRRRRRRRRRSGGRRSGKRRRRRRNARGARPRSEEVVEEKWRTRARRTRVLAGRDRGRPREARPPRSPRARGKRTRGRRATRGAYRAEDVSATPFSSRRLFFFSFSSSSSSR